MTVAAGGAGLTLAFAAVACVHIPSPSFPSIGPGSGDTATFVVDGGVTTVTQSGTITLSGTGTPLDYSGPLGCKGRYFEADYTDNVSMDFRYGSQGAFLLIGNDLYHFASPAVVGDGVLEWSEDFGDRDIQVKVSCPAPPSSGPLSRAPEATG